MTIDDNMSLINEPDIVVGELLNAAVGNEAAQRVFSAYDITASFETNLDLLRKLSSKDLEEAASLLGVVPLVGGKKRYKNRTTLAEWIIMRVVALFPYECGACGEDYQIDRLVEPSRRCHNCGQGAHDCDASLEAQRALADLSLPGFVWLCHPCFTKNRLEAFPASDESTEEEKEDAAGSDDEFMDRI